MSLLSRIEKEYITAYKAKEEVTISVLRLLKTALKNRRVELKRDLEEDEVMDVVARQAKQRQESIDQFSAAGRDDLAAKEAEELVVLKGYLPEALTPEELEKAVDDAIAATGASDMKDMGRVMQAVLGAHKGRADGKAVSALVRSRLAS